MSNDFMSCVKKTLEASNPNVSVTENGAIGYRTTNKPLLDMNFRLSSMRNMSDDHIWTFFLNAYNENPVLAVVWLFFARDVRGGCGEMNAESSILRTICLSLFAEMYHAR